MDVRGPARTRRERLKRATGRHILWVLNAQRAAVSHHTSPSRSGTTASAANGPIKADYDELTRVVSALRKELDGLWRQLDGVGALLRAYVSTYGGATAKHWGTSTVAEHEHDVVRHTTAEAPKPVLFEASRGQLWADVSAAEPLANAHASFGPRRHPDLLPERRDAPMEPCPARGAVPAHGALGEALHANSARAPDLAVRTPGSIAETRESPEQVNFVGVAQPLATSVLGGQPPAESSATAPQPLQDDDSLHSRLACRLAGECLVTWEEAHRALLESDDLFHVAKSALRGRAASRVTAGAG